MKKIPFDAEKARAGVPAYDEAGCKWLYLRENEGDGEYPVVMSRTDSRTEYVFTASGAYHLRGPANYDLHMLEEAPQKSVAQRAREGAKLKTYDGLPARFVAYEEGEHYPLILRIGMNVHAYTEDGGGLIVIDEEPETVTMCIALIKNEAVRFPVDSKDIEKYYRHAEVLASEQVTFTIGKFAQALP